MKEQLMILMAAFVLQRKRLVLVLVKQGLHHNGDKSYFCVNGKKIYNLKVDNKNIKFPVQFCSGNISEKFNALESREVSFKGNLCDFSVDYNAIDKSDILNIHKYLMVKNDIK